MNQPAVQSVDSVQTMYERALDHIVGIQANRIALGLDLIKIEEARAWGDLGFGSFAQLCAAPIPSGGLGLQSRVRQTTMQVARVFVLDMKQRPADLVHISFSNLQLLVPFVTVDNIKDILSDALALSANDVRENRDKGKYGGKEEPMDAETKPSGAKRDLTMECPVCKERIHMTIHGIQGNAVIDVEAF